MKKYVLILSFSALAVSGTYLFGQQGKINADHKELMEHYNTCTRVINEIRDARRSLAIGTSGTWGSHKAQVLGDLQRAEASMFAYRQDLERVDAAIVRQDLHQEVR